MAYPFDSAGVIRALLSVLSWYHAIEKSDWKLSWTVLRLHLYILVLASEVKYMLTENWASVTADGEESLQ